MEEEPGRCGNATGQRTGQPKGMAVVLSTSSQGMVRSQGRHPISRQPRRSLCGEVPHFKVDQTGSPKARKPFGITGPEAGAKTSGPTPFCPTQDPQAGLGSPSQTSMKGWFLFLARALFGQAIELRPFALTQSGADWALRREIRRKIRRKILQTATASPRMRYPDSRTDALNNWLYARRFRSKSPSPTPGRGRAWLENRSGIKERQRVR